MALMNRLRSVFTRPAETDRLSEQSRRQSDKRIVQRLATGSVRVQQGDYVTQRDLDRERVDSSD